MRQIRNQEEFIATYKDIELPDDLDPGSTWEGRTPESAISTVVQKRYLAFRKKLNLVLYTSALVLLVVVLVMVYLFAFKTSFNFYIFSDGTDATCILDPKSGVIKQNVK
jgi:hypothetical protein